MQISIRGTLCVISPLLGASVTIRISVITFLGVVFPHLFCYSCKIKNAWALIPIINHEHTQANESHRLLKSYATCNARQKVRSTTHRSIASIETANKRDAINKYKQKLFGKNGFLRKWKLLSAHVGGGCQSKKSFEGEGEARMWLVQMKPPEK